MEQQGQKIAAAEPQNPQQRSRVDQSIVDLANEKAKRKRGSKAWDHVRNHAFAYVNVVIWSVLIVVVGVCIGAGLQLF